LRVNLIWFAGLSKADDRNSKCRVEPEIY